jgi:ribosome maturation factor RimP
MVGTEAQLDAVRRAVAPVLAGLGFELYDVELQGGGNARTLRVTLTRDDSTDGRGIDLDAITAATQAISPLLDDTAELNGPYLLEVSSPGIERTLRTPQHFEGARGEQVSIKFHTESGPRRVHGVLTAVSDTDVSVEEDGVGVDIALDKITQARTVFEWGPPPRPGKGDKTRARAKGKAKA